ncbi:MAG: mobile mystery protein A [Legionellales bacterium]|nr:mobile mystery protein A [Legionellales bacterium]
MKKGLVTLKQLDQQFAHYNENIALSTPKQGWVRTLRKALGLTIKQLAKRLHVDPSRIVKIETTEIEGAITLRTLKTVAESLNCQFVYCFIPNNSLESQVRTRARELALEKLKRTSHTMDLEAQSISQEWFEQQVKDLTEELLQHSWRYLWEE